MWFLRLLMLLALICWIGGIIFFAFVEAPTLFMVLPSTRLAGDVVSPTLSKLHWMGLIPGLVFLGSSLFYNQVRYARQRLFAATHVFVVLMLALTAISQFGIMPRMRLIRATQQTGDMLPQSTIGDLRSEFDRLHAWSTRLESGILLLGIGVIAMAARKNGN